jgi:RNA polymerase sigma-70 factor (ECF subfamily)
VGVAFWDAEAMADAVRSDPEAFGDAFPRLYKQAYRVAFRLLGSHGDAEDVAQDAMARAYERWRSVGAYEEPAAWITRVAGNRAIDVWRRRNRFPRLTRVTEQLPPDEVRADLHRALASLPRRQREVVVLRYLADQTEAATAAALGCSRGAVKQHASRGLAALRLKLAVPEMDT